MRRLLQYLLLSTGILLAATHAQAFSLLGPLDAYANIPGGNWPVERIGYNVFNTDIGVPVGLGEEYRWNVPVLTYAYDQSFLNYFGQQGVEAIESAIKVLNDLPRASQMNLDDFPTDNKRLNNTAQNLGVQDLKSTALSVMLELFGLAAPERFVWTLRDRAEVTIGGVTFTNYIVVMRNFDPVTLQPTNRVNAASYTFVISEMERPVDWADALELSLDPLEFSYTAVAGALSSPVYNAETNRFVIGAGGTISGSASSLGPGELFPGLTRDDAGGWRYLLRGANWNVEQTATNTTFQTTTTTNGVNPVTNGIAPWTPILVATNIAITNSFGSNAPWTPWVPFTNQFTNVFGTNITNFIDVALRPGVEKVRFKRLNFDSLLGFDFVFTNRYTDTVISNFTRVTQPLQRVQNQPDLLFSAGDLGTTANAESVVRLGRGVARVNNDQLNGFTAQGGPGALRGPMEIQFTDQLPAFEIQAGQSGTFIFPSFVWGSFDETSDDITIFPNSLSLEALEELIRQRLRR